jgi:HEAT repeat protein
LFFAVALSGCHKREPLTSGGRTASYWAEVLQRPDPDVGLRRKAAVKLGPLTLLDKAALPALLRALKDDDAEVRMAAARSLGVYSGSKAAEVVPALRELDGDKDPKVREAAAKAIASLSPS